MQIYIRYQDKNEHVTVLAHQVWDRDLFLASQKKASEDEGGAATEVNRQAYTDANWRKR